jgi:hypothetical protein
MDMWSFHTSVPSSHPLSSETLLEMVTAATLRGWVQAIAPCFANPLSNRYYEEKMKMTYNAHELQTMIANVTSYLQGTKPEVFELSCHFRFLQ